ncbi:hypothetical protein EB796_010965 [Bugula neritina]|uniref:Uncharacterized protein n=1 Tax=Bugula neritina TaxID=10212 RepID=A0A7J7JYB1_BUGNE|nr:hypothetical protein EB796_010965 [Bugula neritina]
MTSRQVPKTKLHHNLAAGLIKTLHSPCWNGNTKPTKSFSSPTPPLSTYLYSFWSRFMATVISLAHE